MLFFLAQCRIKICLCLLLLIVAFPAEAASVVMGKTQAAPKKIAYFEAGEYWEFSLIFHEVKTSLRQSGTLKSLQIPENLHFSPGWGKSEKTYQQIAHKLMSDPSVDLIICMGTAATKALLAENNGNTPIIAMDVANPVGAGFIDADTGKGASNLTIRYVKDKWRQVFLLLAKVIPVKKLGIMYHNSPEGLLYSNVHGAREVAREQGFELVEYPHLDKAESNASCYKGIEYLKAQGIDTFYISALNCFDWDKGNPKAMIDTLHEAHIKTFARDGSVHVRRGALLGLSTLEYVRLGKYYADKIAQILNFLPAGAVVEEPQYHPKITLNLVTADELFVDVPLTLLISADEIFDATLSPIQTEAATQ